MYINADILRYRLIEQALIHPQINPERFWAFRLTYIHYGSESRNWRGLEDYVHKNDEGSIVSRRKRDNTFRNAKNYTWEIYWSVRSIGKRDSGIIIG